MTINGVDIDRSSPRNRAWIDEAIRRIEADENRSADTHLIRVPLTSFPDVDLYLKDESSHPTGSLKHRLARSLFLYALCNGEIGEGTAIVEASSGSTAISEAYFARLLGLPFVAVVPASTGAHKITLIEREGGRCHLVDNPTSIYRVAAELARACSGHFMDQFTFAERATDWRSNNNIAESIFDQMRAERFPVPRWIVVGAGTGGTSATIGRYLRYRRYPTGLAVVDPENSAFLPSWRDCDPLITTGAGSRIEGIGRPRVEPSFVPGVVDRMIAVPDSASICLTHAAEPILGRRIGPSTGTNLWGALTIAEQLRSAGTAGSIVTLLCDGGERYSDSCYDDEWLQRNGIELDAYRGQVKKWLS